MNVPKEILVMSQSRNTASTFAVFQVGSLLVHCPFPCDVLAVFLVGTPLLAPSVHSQAESLLNGDLSFESFSLPSLLVSLQAGRAGKSNLVPLLSIPSHKRSARH